MCGVCCGAWVELERARRQWSDRSDYGRECHRRLAVVNWPSTGRQLASAGREWGGDMSYRHSRHSTTVGRDRAPAHEWAGGQMGRWAGGQSLVAAATLWAVVAGEPWEPWEPLQTVKGSDNKERRLLTRTYRNTVNHQIANPTLKPPLTTFNAMRCRTMRCRTMNDQEGT